MKRAVVVSLIFCLFLTACDYGKLGGADLTSIYYPGDAVFEERMSFLDGVWYSHFAGIGRLDGYRIRKWSNVTGEDIIKMQALFPDLDTANPATFSGTFPLPGDYILMHDGSVYGQQDDGLGGGESFAGFMGIVLAVNIFNNDVNRGSIIIEYFEDAEPGSLQSHYGLAKGEKPFFGIYYRVLSQDTVQLANAVDLAAMYNGEPDYTEKSTLQEAIDFNNVENEAEFISWGVVIPQDREK